MHTTWLDMLHSMLVGWLVGWSVGRGRCGMLDVVGAWAAGFELPSFLTGSRAWRSQLPWGEWDMRGY